MILCRSSEERGWRYRRTFSPPSLPGKRIAPCECLRFSPPQLELTVLKYPAGEKISMEGWFNWSITCTAKLIFPKHCYKDIQINWAKFALQNSFCSTAYDKMNIRRWKTCPECAYERMHHFYWSWNSIILIYKNKTLSHNCKKNNQNWFNLKLKELFPIAKLNVNVTIIL